MTTTEKTQRLDGGRLLEWGTRIFAATGMPEAEAATAADLLVRTSLRGFDVHGVSRISSYAGMLLTDEMNPRPDHGGEMRDGTLFYRGDRGLGQAVGVAAMRQAVEIARTVPMVPCVLGGCGHLAALGMYTLIAAEAGMLAIICQSTAPYMALPGWRAKAIGNNPLAFATPVADGPPLVFDMAASIVARGNVALAVREGTDIPLGWAIGPDGEPTTNSVQIDDKPGSNARMSAFILVVNPSLASTGRYQDDVSEWLGVYLAAAGGKGRYPGQRAAESEARRRVEGIPVPAVTLSQMQEISRRLDVPFDPLPASAGSEL
jgi:LDH2 family malate/lactate/ureidoglycolate dehydrogenase